MKRSLLPPSSILITGCSTGIGHHCALTLHKMGYQVIATCRDPEDVERLKQAGLTSFQLDLADSDSIRSGLAKALEATGGTIDALFNNGAFGLPGAVEDLSRDAMLHQFQTNVFGTQELTNAVVKIMRWQGHGKILYNSSILGFAAMQYRGAYNASKFAVEGFADTLRLEVKRDNIQVSLIEPGPILSDFRKNAYEQFKRWIQLEGSAHQAQYQSMIDRLETVGPSAPFTLGPEAVTDCVIHALQKPQAKIRYRVTVPTKAFAVLKRILPNRWLDRLLIKAGGDGKR
ncbi:SDR family NAD(P)-dependent oxidoreductase [Thiomicrorhabdus sp. ZW0627]|uniref:SDR family NAD(P)-dependent oxidoreductase n=1 Tax=Thiomicrorhabdus sp. ZW0627 TaxID=3039774 RepID=UPI0024371FA1|nr:SDR family NAD(P)-dependent oxidoreductase [Thiomicrorhabdus sp. ZW0627]MDG6772761.1 SDR family NAD(P)-dependent oxidoreductase [Thiomicrorhabdus sp. ZW0627]